jgi:signal transduction histidine kinase/CheY-like chemotaxis protein
MKDVEVGERGYVITGDEEFLQPYRTAVSRVKDQIATLQALLGDEPEQQPHLQSLQSKIAFRLALAKDGIKLRREQGFQAAQAVIATRTGKQTMDEIRIVIGNMEQTERAFLAAREQQGQQSYHLAVLTGGLTALLSLALIVLAYWLVRRELVHRRQAAESLADANRRKNEFLAMLAHELRNPLAPIHNALQLLRRNCPTDPETRWAQDVIDRQAQQMTRLVDDLLDIARITRGEITLRPETIDIAAVVSRALETVQPFINERRHELTVSLPTEPLRLHGDPIRLAQVLANLLNNAARYTDEHGAIRLSVERHGEEILVKVRDTGIGIGAEEMPKIFDLFTQHDRSSRHSQAGLGIGLTLVRTLVLLHKGTIEAVSAGAGQGSEFIVRLPALPETPGAAEVDEAAAETKTARTSTTAVTPPTPIATQARRILVVDDNVDGARSLSLLLRQARHDVRTAHDGPTALQIAREWRPDLVLLDIGLPGMSGLEVARAMRSEPTLKDITILAMTGYGQDSDRLRSHEAGFNAHLVKPLDLEMLNEFIARTQPERANPPAA